MSSRVESVVCLAPRLLGPVPQTLAHALGDSPMPNLEWLLSRGQPMQIRGSGSEGLLAERFPFLPPVGPLVAAAHAREVKPYCYRAAPIHLRADRDRLLVFAGDDCALTEDAAESICHDVNALFKDDGLHLGYFSGEWLLSFDTPPGPDLPPLSAVAGRYLDTVIPMDQSAQRWRQLLNELQMFLHAHPVNQARESAGLIAVNGLWAWGGGRCDLPDPQITPADQWLFTGDHALAQGANARIGLPDQSPIGRVWIADAAERALMSGDAGAWLAAVQTFEDDEAAALRALCETGRSALELHVGEGMAWAFSGVSRWRFWRRRRPLRSSIQGVKE